MEGNAEDEPGNHGVEGEVMSRKQVLRLNFDGSTALCKGCGFAMLTTDPEDYHRACLLEQARVATGTLEQYRAATLDYITCRRRPRCESCKKFEKMIRALGNDREPDDDGELARVKMLPAARNGKPLGHDVLFINGVSITTMSPGSVMALYVRDALKKVVKS